MAFVENKFITGEHVKNRKQTNKVPMTIARSIIWTINGLKEELKNNPSLQSDENLDAAKVKKVKDIYADQIQKSNVPGNLKKIPLSTAAIREIIRLAEVQLYTNAI